MTTNVCPRCGRPGVASKRHGTITGGECIATADDPHAAYRAHLEAAGLTADEARRLQESDLAATEGAVDRFLATLSDDDLAALTDDEIDAIAARLVDEALA